MSNWYPPRIDPQAELEAADALLHKADALLRRHKGTAREPDVEVSLEDEDLPILTEVVAIADDDLPVLTDEVSLEDDDALASQQASPEPAPPLPLQEDGPGLEPFADLDFGFGEALELEPAESPSAEQTIDFDLDAPAPEPVIPPEEVPLESIDDLRIEPTETEPFEAQHPPGAGDGEPALLDPFADLPPEPFLPSPSEQAPTAEAEDMPVARDNAEAPEATEVLAASEAAETDTPAVPAGPTPEELARTMRISLAESLISLDTEIQREVQAWFDDELPQLLSRELDRVTERLRAEALAHLRSTLLPSLSERISRRMDELMGPGD